MGTRVVFDKRTLRKRYGAAFAAAILEYNTHGSFLDEVAQQLGGDPSPLSGEEPVKVRLVCITCMHHGIQYALHLTSREATCSCEECCAGGPDHSSLSSSPWLLCAPRACACLCVYTCMLFVPRTQLLSPCPGMHASPCAVANEQPGWPPPMHLHPPDRAPPGPPGVCAQTAIVP